MRILGQIHFRWWWKWQSATVLEGSRDKGYGKDKGMWWSNYDEKLQR